MMRLAIFLIIFSLNLSNLNSGNLFGADFERSTVSLITRTSLHQFRVEVAKTEEQHRIGSVSYTHLTLPTIYSV